MAAYDGVSTQKEVMILLEAALDADNTPVAKDTLNYRAASICTIVGAGGITFDATNKIEFKLLHGDDTTYGNAVEVEAEDVIMPFGETLGAGGVIRSLVAAHAAIDAEAHQVGYIGKKRYLYLLADFSGTHGAGTDICAFIRLGNPLHQPTDQANYEAASPY